MPGAQFFCENCGAGVDRKTGRCPSCGRVFASVRCPKCGFTGGEGLFKNGCPVCSYCSGTADMDGRFRPASSRHPAVSSVPAKLPVWVYALAVLGLSAALAVLFFALK